MSVTEVIVNANGVQLWTATQGAGPPVVLIHGGPGIYDYLGPVAGMIDDLATVHRYDQRGCGRSQHAGPHDIAKFIADLDALRVHWGYVRWTLVGHSWGATLALLYAAQLPGRMSGLVYMSGTGIDPGWHRQYRINREARLSANDRERFQKLSGMRADADGEELARINAERADLLEPTEYHDYANLSAESQHDLYSINYEVNAVLNRESDRLEESGDLPALVSKISAPTLVLDGAADPRPRWARAQIAGLIAGSRHVTLPRCGHDPWVEQPAATARVLRGFRADCGASGR